MLAQKAYTAFFWCRWADSYTGKVFYFLPTVNACSLTFQCSSHVYTVDTQQCCQIRELHFGNSVTILEGTDKGNILL